MHVEANHAPNKVLAHRFLPGSFGAAERDLDLNLLSPLLLELEDVLRVVDPGLFIGVLRELLVVQVGTTVVLVGPLT